MRIQTLNAGTPAEQTIFRDRTGLVIAVSRKHRPVEWRWLLAGLFVGTVIAIVFYKWWQS